MEVVTDQRGDYHLLITSVRENIFCDFRVIGGHDKATVDQHSSFKAVQMSGGGNRRAC